MWAPYYGATIGVAFARFWKKYATFSGRASRSEFWWWQLIYGIALVVIDIAVFFLSAPSVLSRSTGPGALNPGWLAINIVIWILWLATIVPTVALVWRRLHDTGRNGSYFFFGLIPLVGAIFLLVFLVTPSDPTGARFDDYQA
jgi:uncharacterized membrane protein YhaH (DUF805 family)